MNRRQKIIVSVTGIFLVLLILVGLTYAYFLTQIQGNEEEKSITVTTANLIVEYGDGNNILAPTNKIMPDDVVGTKTFTVTNKGNDTSNYVVVIEDVVVTNATTNAATTFETNDFVYTLTCNKYNRTEYEANPNTAVSTGTCNGVSEETEFPLTGGLVVRDEINVGEVYLYGLTLTYKDNGNDQSNDMNKTLSAKVNIKNEEEYITLANTVETTFQKGISIDLRTTEAIEDSEIESKAMSFPFKITNTGDEHMNVTIKLTDITMADELKDVNFRWGLYNSVTGNGLSFGALSDIGNATEVTIYRDTIIDAAEPDITNSYVLRIWIHDNGAAQDSLMGRSFSARVKVTGEAIEYTPESCFGFDSSTGTINAYSDATNSGNCPSNLVIPRTIGEVAVTKIGDDTFYAYENNSVYITGVIIPNSVNEIGQAAFMNNTSPGVQLSHLTIPEGVTTIGNYAFEAVDAETIYLPDTVETIGNGGLNMYVSSNKTFVIPGSVKELKYDVFNNLGKQNLILMEGITTIYGGISTATYDSSMSTIEIPSSVTNIDFGAFSNLLNLTEIVVRGKTAAPEGFVEGWNCVDGYDGKCNQYANVVYRP